MVTYYVNTSGVPPDSLAAIQAAMKMWTDVPSSSFRFVYGGPTTSTIRNPNDGINIICFRNWKENKDDIDGISYLYP